MSNDEKRENQEKKENQNSKTKRPRRKNLPRSLPDNLMHFQLPNNIFEFEPDSTDKGSKPIKDFEPKK